MQKLLLKMAALKSNKINFINQFNFDRESPSEKFEGDFFIIFDIRIICKRLYSFVVNCKRISSAKRLVITNAPT